MLSPARFRQLHQGTTVTARKVFDVIPISEEWRFGQIVAEMERHGVTMRYNILQGCVATLVETGLVREPRPGHFIRAQVREVTADQAIIAPINFRKSDMPTPPQQPSKKSHLERLGELAQRLRGIGEDAARMVVVAKTLADDIDSVAIDMEEEGGVNMMELTKLRQLRELLRET